MYSVLSTNVDPQEYIFHHIYIYQSLLLAAKSLNTVCEEPGNTSDQGASCEADRAPHAFCRSALLRRTALVFMPAIMNGKVHFRSSLTHPTGFAKSPPSGPLLERPHHSVSQ